MITSLERMIGLPVVLGTRRVGYVERAVPDASARCLAGLVVRRGIGSARWCPAEEIALIGRDSVCLHTAPGMLPKERQTDMPAVYLTTGKRVGQVTDAILVGQNLAALEVSPGPVYRLMGRCAYAREYRVSGSCVTVCELMSWPELKRRLGEEDEGWT